MSEARREQPTNGYCHCVIISESGGRDFCARRELPVDQPFCDDCEATHQNQEMVDGQVATVWVRGPDGKRVVRMP